MEKLVRPAPIMDKDEKNHYIYYSQHKVKEMWPLS